MKTDKKILNAVAEQLNFELSDDFFDLGNLNKNSLTLNSCSGSNLKGASEEIQKYKKIVKLLETIAKALDWASVEKNFSEKRCLRLAIQNCGNAIDEDVEITFEIPQNALLTLAEFSQFENNEMGYLLNYCDMSVLFGINSTAEYIVYSESTRNPHASCIPHSYGLPVYAPDYSDDFIEKLNDVFCYSIYSSENNYIVKLKVDYIKHNTTVAFPSVLFVKAKIIEIPYKITSKNSPDIVEGILKVQSSNI